MKLYIIKFQKRILKIFKINNNIFQIIRRISYFIVIIRPINSIMVGLAVVVGITLTSVNNLLSMKTLLGFLTGFFISSYSMVTNDYYDIEVDRINCPNKSIPSNKIKPKEAILYAFLLLFLGEISSLLIGPTNFVIATIFSLIAWIYNYWGKKKMFIGNIMVASSVAIPYLYGGTAFEKLGNQLLWFLALTSFLAAAGREIVKTITDIEGDRARNVNSISISHGSELAGNISAIFFIGAVATTILPIITKTVVSGYSSLIIIPDILFLYASIKIIKDKSKENAFKIKRFTLVGMLVGMIVFMLEGLP